MKAVFITLLVAFPLSGCISSSTSRGMDDAYRSASARLPQEDEEAAPLQEVNPAAALGRDELVQMSVERSPSLAALAHRARAMIHAGEAEGSLPSPELGLEAWNLPIARPYSLNEADMYMVELKQRFPAAGSLDARARIALEQATAMLAEVSTEERLTAERAALAHADYLHGTRDHVLHGRHLDLLRQMRGAVAARFSTGGSLADLSRIDFEVAKTRRAIARINGDMAQARAEINSLLRRPADAPLGPPVDGPPETVRLSVEELTGLARANRGSQVAADARLRGAEARQDAARAEARIPEFMVGVGYWQDPAMRPGFGANVSMTLPWLWGPGGGRVSEADELKLAEQASEDAVLLDAQAVITNATTRLTAVENELRILSSEAIPASRRSIDAIRVSYATGNVSLLEFVDAARSELDLEMESTDLMAELARTVAALERGVGMTLPRQPVILEAAQ